MVINKKKRQPCSGIIQNMITFRKKFKSGAHTHTPYHEQCARDTVRMCSVLSNTCHGLNKRQT